LRERLIDELLNEGDDPSILVQKDYANEVDVLLSDVAADGTPHSAYFIEHANKQVSIHWYLDDQQPYEVTLIHECDNLEDAIRVFKDETL
jgi:hypothetical protein